MEELKFRNLKKICVAAEFQVWQIIKNFILKKIEQRKTLEHTHMYVFKDIEFDFLQ